MLIFGMHKLLHQDLSLYKRIIFQDFTKHVKSHIAQDHDRYTLEVQGLPPRVGTSTCTDCTY